MAFPIMAVLAGVSLLGGVLGSKGRKSIDPEALKKLFGPDAVTADTVAFFNNMINSPEGSAMLNQASVIGADVSNRINARAAQSGMAGGGAESGVGQFAAAAGGSAGDLLKGQVRGDMFSRALQAAVQNNAARMGVYGQSKMLEQQTPTFAQALGAGLQSGAGTMAAGIPSKSKATTTDTASLPSSGNAFMDSYSGSKLGLATPNYATLSAPPAGMGEGAYSASMFNQQPKKFGVRRI